MKKTLLLRGLPVVVFFLLWQLVATLVDSTLLPTPLAVFAAIVRDIDSGDLLFNLGATLARVAVSFVIAMLIGSAIGISMGRYQKADLSLDSLLVLGLNVPALVTIILCYVWFGLGETAAIIAVVVNKVPIVVVTLREGTRAIDPRLLAVAQAYRLSRRQTLVRIYLPQLYPYLISAARNGLALIWKIVLVVELLGLSSGVGFKLYTFFQFFDITNVLAYTLTFVAVVWLVEALLMRPVERRLTRWRS
ncbi:MAG: ABC transporter permease subunit [Sinobacteraceae bacterium]|nr:ABC transporter permease subunit [Nevskiaceae bacterium]